MCFLFAGRSIPGACLTEVFNAVVCLYFIFIGLTLMAADWLHFAFRVSPVIMEHVAMVSNAAYSCMVLILVSVSVKGIRQSIPE